MTFTRGLAAGAITTALVLTVALLLTRRRDIPQLQLAPDEYPPIAEGIEMLSGLTQNALYTGNRVEILQNGDVFPRMLEDIRAARCSVHLETFVWAAGELERCFVGALSEQAERGIPVRVLIDAVGGSRADPDALDRLRTAGAEVAFYCRPRWWNWLRFNHRTHRKLLVVDGRIGYTFGHGIGDQWLGSGDDPDHWRDTAVRVEGPVVHGLQAVFAENWVEETHRLPSGAACWPALESCGTARAHVVSSASGEAISSVGVFYTLAIASARREVLIQNPYFVPDPSMVDLLRSMIQRGVRILLMLPGRRTDSPFVRRAGCHLYDQLLDAGVRLFEFQPTLLHQKIVIVDGEWAHIGSTNFDARSLALNEEVGLGVVSADVAQELKQAFRRDLEHCRELTPDVWRRRSAADRLIDRGAYLLHDQL